MNKNKTPTCGFCGRNLHCQLLSDCITNAFCFGCKRDIPLDAIRFIEDPQKAISVKQPWAYLICVGIKDIENRTWRCPDKYIGKRIYIHASNAKVKFDNWYGSPLSDEQLLALPTDFCECDMLQTGSIIGHDTITDCVINHSSVWAEKTPKYLTGLNTKLFEKMEGIKPIYNWVLSDPVLFDEPILDVKGKLSFWDCSEYLKRAV